MTKTEFSKLKAIWDKKLKASGFEDAETSKGKLKKWSTKPFSGTSNQHSETWMESKRNYYELVGHFLTEHAFESKTDKAIWEYHAEGYSIREIVKLLKKGKGYSKSEISRTIVKLQDLMKKKYKVTNG